MKIMDGYEPDPDEVRAVVDSIIDAEDLADPTALYVRATKMYALYAAVAEELGGLRADAVGRIAADGLSQRQIAAHLGMSYPRAQQLVAKAKTRGNHSPVNADVDAQ